MVFKRAVCGRAKFEALHAQRRNNGAFQAWRDDSEFDCANLLDWRVLSFFLSLIVRLKEKKKIKKETDR